MVVDVRVSRISENKCHTFCRPKVGFKTQLESSLVRHMVTFVLWLPDTYLEHPMFGNA